MASDCMFRGIVFDLRPFTTLDAVRCGIRPRSLLGPALPAYLSGSARDCPDAPGEAEAAFLSGLGQLL